MTTIQTEFPTPRLAAFAAAWQSFQRSSPVTAARASFPYFSAPDADHMDENDVLYGRDRNEAYGELMDAFTACRKAGEFGRFFDASHTRYWESRSLPGLVLLSQWAKSPSAPPGLYLAPAKAASPSVYDVVIFTAASVPEKAKNPYGNLYAAPALAPRDGYETYLRTTQADALAALIRGAETRSVCLAGGTSASRNILKQVILTLQGGENEQDD